MEFDLKKCNDLAKQKLELKRKIEKKLHVLSVLSTEDYTEAILKMDRAFIEELLVDAETHKIELQKLQNKYEKIKKHNKERKERSITKVGLKMSKDRKRSRDGTISSTLSFEQTGNVSTTNSNNDQPLKPPILYNIFNYNEYYENGNRKIISKKDLYQKNFSVMFHNFLQKSSFPPSHYINEFIFNWKFQKFESILMTSISGPEDSSSDDLTYGNYASCEAISLYPHCPGRPYREGDPICDRLHISLFLNRIIACLTDGCNWGDKPRKASRKANKIIINYLKDNLDNIKSIQNAIYTLIAALADAQITIIDGAEEWMSGTTTASCGLLIEVDHDFQESSYILDRSQEDIEEQGNGIFHAHGKNEETIVLSPTKWVFVSANIGDCKILHLSLREELKVEDITGNMRSNSTDLTDPGGRLGSFKDGWPDLRNLCVNYQAIDEGDIIIMMSDGVHDNLDPQTLGLSPRDFDLDSDRWETASEKQVSDIKRIYLSKLIEKMLKSEEIITPKVVKDKLINHCIEITTKSRNFMSNNPMLKVPGDYSQYPGKLDHTSIICFRAGRTNRLSKKDTKTTQFPVVKYDHVIFHPPPPSKPNHVVILPPPPIFQSPDLIDEVKQLLNTTIEIVDYPPRFVPLTSVVRHSSISNNTTTLHHNVEFASTH